jgi:hypothetical protein
MNKLFLAMLVAIHIGAGCTETTPTVNGGNASGGPIAEDDAGVVEEMPDSEAALNPNASLAPEDRCLDGQDLNAPDVDVSKCPAVPTAPAKAMFMNNPKLKVDLGAWEIGTTGDKVNWAYGSLSAASTDPRILTWRSDVNMSNGATPVNAQNLECWAKGYYRLRAMLQNPPAEYVALRKLKNPTDPNGFQYRFFQFQTDLRNGATGFKAIASFQSHLVKWVTVVNKDGTCDQPTFSKFQKYAAAELKTHPVAVPAADAGADAAL